MEQSFYYYKIRIGEEAHSRVNINFGRIVDNGLDTK